MKKIPFHELKSFITAWSHANKKLRCTCFFNEPWKNLIWQKLWICEQRPFSLLGFKKSSHLENAKTFLPTQCPYGNYSNFLPRKAISGIYNLKLYIKHSTFLLLLALVLFFSLSDLLQEGERLKLCCLYDPCPFYRFFSVDFFHRKIYEQGDRTGSESPSVVAWLPTSHALIQVCVTAGARLFCATYFPVFCQCPLFMEGPGIRSQCQQEELAGQE